MSNDRRTGKACRWLVAACLAATCGCGTGQRLAGDEDDGTGPADVGADADRDSPAEVGGPDGPGEIWDDAIPPELCTCLDPRDGCENLTCVRYGYHCDALHACDVGYECEGGSCYCHDREICGIDCSETGFCGGLDYSLVCATDGLCRPPLHCISDEMCAPGQLCINDSAGFSCITPGSAEVGAACSRDVECREGVCETNICLHRCRSNSDCDAGQFCSGTRENQYGCMVTPGCSSCFGATQYCDEGRCETGPCRTGADCPGGECEMHLGPLAFRGRCVSSALACRDDEFVGETIPDRCLVHAMCWTAIDCPPGYVCLVHEADGANVCARTP